MAEWESLTANTFDLRIFLHGHHPSSIAKSQCMGFRMSWRRDHRSCSWFIRVDFALRDGSDTTFDDQNLSYTSKHYDIFDEEEFSSESLSSILTSIINNEAFFQLPDAIGSRISSMLQCMKTHKVSKKKKN